nr:alpha/beta fold hydrolase [Hahella ganghwensis]
MHVPENHQNPDSHAISFPVAVFKSNKRNHKRTPVLHLGAGGPGSAMYLDDTDSMMYFIDIHRELSLDQGRDLYVMDPRGAGLAEPLLNCGIFAENEFFRWGENLSIKEDYEASTEDYQNCINEFRDQGVDFSQYNSLAVANDVEFLRRAVDVDQWNLIGVSYGSVYAQIITREYPSSVRTMILDSAAFPQLKGDYRYLEKSIGPLNKLLNYCTTSDDCKLSIDNTEDRFWKLYNQLNEKPIRTKLDFWGEETDFTIVLNGTRFVSSIVQGLYGKQIFRELPVIITDMEQRDLSSLMPYLVDYFVFQVDEFYGDLSFSSHYCYETKPFTDFDHIRSELDALPEGQLKTLLTMIPEDDDLCDEMQVSGGDPIEAEPVKTSIPTLFLQGEYDTVTPLKDVLDLQSNFSNSYVVSFKQSHDVLSSSLCAGEVAARFISGDVRPASLTGCDSEARLH